MNSIKRLLLSTCIAAGASFAVPAVWAAPAVELLQNGGFETGSLDGWLSSTNMPMLCCDSSSPTGSYVANSGGVGPALTGQYALFGDFDGEGPGEILLSQTFTKVGQYTQASLAFDYLANVTSWNLPRELNVTFVQGASNVSVYASTFGGGTNMFFGPSIGANWSHVGVDVTSALNSFANGAVTMVVSRVVPERFTGPGYFGADNFSLMSATVPAVPEPESYAMFAAGLGVLGAMAKRRRRV